MADRLFDHIGNKKVSDPIYDQDEFEDILMTSNQHDKYVDIKYESYEYDGAVRIVSLKVNLNGLFEHNFDYLQEQITEAIGLRLNKHNIVMECKLQIV